jgi:SAM-dependent methyltransferase
MNSAAHKPHTLAARVPGRECFDLHFARRGMGEEFDMEASWIQRRIPADASCVLDVGCGNGALFGVIGSSRVLGLERCESGLVMTRSRHPSARVICGDAVRLPLSDGCVDAVTAQHVIEHLAAYDAACREWFRVLAPGGLLVVLTPNLRFTDPGVFADETHVHLFDSGDLSGTLTRAGFEVQELCSLGLPWFRNYRRLPSGWRFRRLVTRRSSAFSIIPLLKWRGQTLCCAARKPI